MNLLPCKIDTFGYVSSGFRVIVSPGVYRIMDRKNEADLYTCAAAAAAMRYLREVLRKP